MEPGIVGKLANFFLFLLEAHLVYRGTQLADWIQFSSMDCTVIG